MEKFLIDGLHAEWPSPPLVWEGGAFGTFSGPSPLAPPATDRCSITCTVPPPGRRESVPFTDLKPEEFVVALRKVRQSFSQLEKMFNKTVGVLYLAGPGARRWLGMLGGGASEY